MKLVVKQVVWAKKTKVHWVIFFLAMRSSGAQNAWGMPIVYISCLQMFKFSKLARFSIYMYSCKIEPCDILERDGHLIAGLSIYVE